MSKPETNGSLAKQIASELAINKMTIKDGQPVSSLLADRDGYYEYRKSGGYKFVPRGPSRSLSRERVFRALDALNEGIRIGFSGLVFPESAEIVREVSLDAVVANIPVLDWAVGRSDVEGDHLYGAISRKGLEVATAVIVYGGEVRAAPAKVVLENNRDAIARGAKIYSTWAEEYVEALKLTAQGTRGFAREIKRVVKSRDASRSIATSNYYAKKR